MSRGNATRPTSRRLAVVLLGSVLGLTVPGGPSDLATAGETATPETMIVRHPVDPTTSRRAFFEQRSPTTSAFECRLDRRKWKGCWIEVKYKGLDVGKHVFRVRAVDDGVKDPTPARYQWTIVAQEGGS